MRGALARWGTDGIGEWSDPEALLGQTRVFTTPEARHEALPAQEHDGRFVLTATARLDNREELVRELGVPARERERTADGALVQAAYRRWGRAAPARLFGDWSFAAWHPRERTWFIARDHHGSGTVYYHADRDVVAFACAPQAIHALGIARPVLDELYLGQLLMSWPAYHGERTIGTVLRGLAPAHCMTVTEDRIEVSSYWDLDHVGELRLRRPEDYVEPFREHLAAAVHARLRCSGRIGFSLSSGLDSGSVAVTAAAMLAPGAERPVAFTSVPIADTRPYLESWFGDERPLAAATAAAAGFEHVLVDARDVSPITALRATLEVQGAPGHAAGNQYWLREMLRLAAEYGCRTLLTGQKGNEVISWHGNVLSQPLSYAVRKLGVQRFAKQWVKQRLPWQLSASWAQRRTDPLWYRATALHPDFARRLDLARRRALDAEQHPRSPLQERVYSLRIGRFTPAGLWSASASGSGLDVRDPTTDVRLMTFAMSIPDDVWIDPRTGTRRWLIRAAMAGRLPDEVRLEARKGRQAADLVPRLRRHARDVESALDEVESGAAVTYLDVPYMREVWRMVQDDDTPEALTKSVTVLTRGIMAGLYVNKIGSPG
jgi:asparagine synthase (glutamine-hydrolysing)